MRTQSGPERDRARESGSLRFSVHSLPSGDDGLWKRVSLYFIFKPAGWELKRMCFLDANRPYGLIWYRFKFENGRTIFKLITR